MIVRLKAICKFDEENENEAIYDDKEITTDKKSLRPAGDS